MINIHDIMETINMISEENLDIRTITMGISLLDCCDSDIEKSCQKVYDKITRLAGNLVKTGEDIEKEFGIPIINKRISVTPISMLVAASGGDPVLYAKALQRAADATGVNFIGGYSALVHKGFAAGDEELIRSIPRALSETNNICSSVNIGSTKAGINMDAVKLMGEIVRETAEITADRECIGCAKLVVFCNAVEDNPLWQVLFTVWVSPTVLSMLVFRAPVLCRPQLKSTQMPLWAKLPRLLNAQLLKLPVWVSLSVTRHLAV